MRNLLSQLQTGTLGLLAGVALIAPAMACNAPSSPDASIDDRNELVGGVDGRSRALDAVGALVYKDPATGASQLLCTATLIAPKVILTAKHCAMDKWVAPVDGGAPRVQEARYIDTLEALVRDRRRLASADAAGPRGVGGDVQPPQRWLHGIGLRRRRLSPGGVDRRRGAARRGDELALVADDRQAHDRDRVRQPVSRPERRTEHASSEASPTVP